MIGQHVGKYRVLDRVGRGGMGTVYLAIDETLNREVAIKVLNADINDPSLARRFRAEAVTVARLNHPGIAMVYELLEHDGQWLMVMEFLRGETLESLVSREKALPVDRAVALMMQALDALGHAHGMGVVHRDLKPANLMIAASGTVKVMDFGIARVAGAEQLTRAGFMMGTPAYMAPEQVLDGEIDARTDLYAIGVVLYHLTTGKLPFKGETPMEMAQSRIADEPTPARVARQDLPPWLAEVLDVALARSPERRFPSAAAFRENLRRGLSGLPLEIPVSPTIPPELVATAAPRSLPVLPSAPPASTRPPADAMPTIAASVPASGPGPARSRMPVYGALAGAAALLVTVGAWLMLGSSRDGQSASSPEPPVAAAANTPAPGPEPAPMPTTEPAATPAKTPAATALNSSSSSAQPAAGATVGAIRAPAATAGTAGALPPVGGAGMPASSAATPPGPTPSSPRDWATAVNFAPLAFSGVRALVVSGKKASEENATLQFTSVGVAVVGQNGASLGTLLYRDVTYASYVRGKDPKWSVVLASPPADVDLPSGFFSLERHWLTLQSRSSYLIVRLNDNDWRQVTEAVSARTGVIVEVSR